MSDHEPQQNVVPDPAVVDARARLADWLNAQAVGAEYGVTIEDLEGWQVESQEEFLLFAPPGYANQLFLVSDQGISSYAPSDTTLDEAMAVARQQA